MSATPRALLLDVNGTLFSATAAAPAFKKLGLDEDLVELWFARVLRDAFAAQAAGLFRAFKDIGAYHLEVMLAAADSNSGLTGAEAMAEVTAAWASAALYQDIPAALHAIISSGIKVAVLTNGSAEAVAKPVLTAGGAMQLITEPLLDVNMAQAWKPFHSSYAFAVSKLGLSERDVLMVASHPWDIAGAMQAGLRGCFVQRNRAECWHEYLPAPDAVVTSFTELAELLGAAAMGV